MKIDFDLNLEGYQQAHRLRLLLDHCLADEPDNVTGQLINDLKKQVDAFIARPELDEFRKAPGSGRSVTVDSTGNFLNRISLLWSFITGPSRRELLLSKQRRELIERAEHAENTAFQALAESADINKKNEDAVDKIRILEQELEKIRSGK